MQPTSWDVANIGTAWGDIINDARNWGFLIIHFSVSSSWKVLYNPLFFLENNAPTTTFVFIFAFSS